jgi:hypothetical protein
VDLSPTYFERIVLTSKEALSYLMCNTSAFNLQIPERSQILVTYKGLNLGFIRKISNSYRIDYPKSWRILKQGMANDIL